MNINRIYLIFFSLLVMVSAGVPPVHSSEKSSENKVGFMVVAPDRGFMGNQEILEIYQEFKKDYPASLSLVGRNDNGTGSPYSAYLQKSVQSLQESGVTDIVALPLFLSQDDPVLRKVAANLPAYHAREQIRLAPPMSESYLSAQVLLDRVKTVSQNPAEEHLVVLGIGAMEAADEEGIRSDIAPLIDYVKQYIPFHNTEVGIYFDRNAETSLKEAKNQGVDDLIIRTAAKKGRTIVVPFYIGPRFDNRMSMTNWLSRKFSEYDLTFVKEEIIPHPNVLLWLKKTANHYLVPKPDQVGVIIMPHGSTQPYNDVVEEIIAPLKSRYRIEMAYGMGDPFLIQQAVTRLETEGVRRIIFVRMYSLEDQMKGLTDYILGLSKTAPTKRNPKDTPPTQVRSAALFSAFGGYEEGPDIPQVLHERVLELSRNPSRETVILVAHGSGSDEADARWLEVMDGHASRLQKLVKFKFQDIQTATVREDWPEKREAAVNRLKEMIEKAKKKGRVLLISNRLHGAGPYERFLNEVGLEKDRDYEMNSQGFAPHPLMTRWLASGIEQAIRSISQNEDWMVSAQQTNGMISKQQ